MISIIIVSYNSGQHIGKLLNTLLSPSFRYGGKNIEIIVVDNNSTDNSVKTIESFSNPHLRLVKSRENLGFAGGCNLGYQYARGEFIALLNPDTSPAPAWLSNLIKYVDLKKYQKVGIFASKIINVNAEERVIDSAADGCTTFAKGFKRGEGEEISAYNRSEYVFGACGAGMLIRRQLLEDIGFFDDYMFLIHEDTEFCLRAQIKGWKVFYVAEAILYHQVRSSIGNLSDMAVYYSLRNADYTWLKLLPARLMARFIHEKLLFELGNILFFLVRHKKIIPFLKAKIHLLYDLPKILKRRRDFKKQVGKIDDAYMATILTSVFDRKLLMQKVTKLFKG